MVIIGGGLAGGNAAVTLREEGFEGRIVLIGHEPGVPFGRPPLSKTYLRAEEDLEGWYVKPEDWYAEHDVERLIDTTVVGIDTAAHTVVLSSERELVYQKLLLATGGQNRRFDVPGSGLRGIHQLRTVAECDAIKREAVAGRTAVVVGMGFIGCEVAASLTQLGVRVTAIFPEQVPLQRVLGAEAGAVIGAFHRANGVQLVAGDQINACEGDGEVEAVVTGNGARVECDFAVAGLGIEPDLSACAGSTIAHENGILVDERCRTSEADVYAAGDVANILHPLFGRVRVEHYNNAEKQGRAAARSMLGSTDPYDYVYTFWSDQYDHKLEYAGYAAKWDEFIVRGSLEEGRLVGLYLMDGQLRAAVGLDRGGDPEADEDSEMAACARLIGMRARPAPRVLADENADLWELTR
jgi:3-phenylpropionate/trans-cinnamate dioxygenase ferredoxin reductase subunit